MKHGPHVVGWALLVAATLSAGSLTGAPLVRTNLYSTSYEYLEGFNPAFVLATQNGWQDYAEYQGNPIGNLLSSGLVTNVFVGYGQQGWIGGPFVNQPVDSVNLWHPLIIDPVPTSTPIVKFSVQLAIEAGTQAKFDFFRWSFYNSLTNRLFSLDFENANQTIAYQLDDGVFRDVPVQFVADTIHHLEVSIHFAANQWNAWLDGEQMVTNAPVTTTNQRRTLGEIDALWLPSNPTNRTDKRMYFDSFQLSAESIPTPPAPPTLLTLGRTTNGFYALRLLGEPNARFALDYSANATTWTPLKTNIAVDGSFDYVDTNAPIVPARLFRARWLSE